MIVLENGQYYQVRIIPHPQDRYWSLEAVVSMLLATAALPDSPTPLLEGQPPDPLTAIVSGTVGTWQPGHAPYCLWQWSRRRWPHTGDMEVPPGQPASSWRPSPSASGQQRPPLRPTCAPTSRSTRSGRWRWAGNCSPPSALRRRPGRHTRPLCTKSSVPSPAPSRGAWRSPQDSEPPRAKIGNTPS